LSDVKEGKRTKFYSAKFAKGTAAERVAALKSNPEIEYVEPDSIATKVEVPNDPMIGSQWGLAKIQSFGAWDTTHGSGSVNIAVLDTGVDGGHPDVGGNISLRANFTNVPDGDIDGHGTHVAGIASAITNNGIGIAGVGYTSHIMSGKVLDDNGSGYYSWIANGIMWAADNGASVINMSLGGSSGSTALQQAIQYAWSKGSIVVAAAGNSGSQRAFYPAYYTPAIAVAATDQNDKKASFSNYGSWVDVAAPGVSILSSYQGNYAYLSGTSMATPFVSGLAALVKGDHPDWTNAQIVNKIETSADAIPGTGTSWIYGRINACSAVDCTTTIILSTPTPTPTATPTPTPTPGIPTPTLTPTPTVTPTPTPGSPTITLTPTPTPTPSSKPWWCKYLPTNSRCL
jgi:thermitase